MGNSIKIQGGRRYVLREMPANCKLAASHIAFAISQLRIAASAGRHNVDAVRTRVKH